MQMNRFNHLVFLLGVATTATLVVSQPAHGKSAKEVARIAVPTTVRIDNPLGNDYGGSGVIIARNGNTYTVLTAAHVIQNPNLDYQIYTSKKKSYPVTSIKNLQATPDAPDLAVITFNSPDEQAIAPLTNSDEASIGAGIYISGYPLSSEVAGQREYEFTAGQVSSRPNNRPQGYTIRYDAVTRRGMSGGPVFDVDGRVVGIHGQGDRDAVVKNESASGTGRGTTEIKTGFNAAIPINTFMSIASRNGISTNGVTVDQTQAKDEVAVQPSRQEIKSWEKDFAKEVGLQLIRSLPIPSLFRF